MVEGGRKGDSGAGAGEGVVRPGEGVRSRLRPPRRAPDEQRAGPGDEVDGPVLRGRATPARLGGACERHCRAWALLHDFGPWRPATARANEGRRSPAEGLNRHRRHDDWLQDLLVSASLGGFRCWMQPPHNPWLSAFFSYPCSPCYPWFDYFRPEGLAMPTANGLGSVRNSPANASGFWAPSGNGSGTEPGARISRRRKTMRG